MATRTTWLRCSLFLLGGLLAAGTDITEWDVALQSGRNASRAGRPDEAERFFRQSLDIAERTHHVDQIANSVTHIAVLLRERGDYGAASPLFERALQLYRAIDSRPNICRALNNLASVYQVTRRATEAEALYRQAISLASENNEDSEAAIVASSNLASLLGRRGDLAGSLSMLRVAERRAQAESAREALAPILSQMGALYRTMGRFEQAETMIRRSLDLRLATLGKEHTETAIALNNLGDLYAAQGRYQEAEPLLVDAARICRQTMKSWRCASILNNLGSAEQGLGRSEDAEKHFREAVELAATGKEHALGVYAASLNNLGKLYVAQRRLKEGRAAYRTAMASWESTNSTGHPDYASTLVNLGILDLMQKHYAEAEQSLRRALAIDEKFLGPDHAKVALDRSTLATLLVDRKRYAEAEQLMREVLARREDKDPNSPETALAAANLGEALARQKRYEEAAALYGRAWKIWDGRSGSAPANQLALLTRYEEILRAIEEYGQAEMVAAKAMRIRVKSSLEKSLTSN